MKRLQLLIVAALLGVAVPASAQRQVHSRGPHVEAGVVRVGDAIGARVGARAPHGGRHGSPRQHGRWEVRYEQVLVPGYWQVEQVPATYGWIYSLCGHRHWGIVAPARTCRTWVPPRWETRPQRVWVRC